MFLDDADLDSRIEKVRKGDFTVKFINSKGEALVGKDVAYKLTRLDFTLGTVLYWSIFERPETDTDRKTFLTGSSMKNGVTAKILSVAIALIMLSGVILLFYFSTENDFKNPQI